jgi:ELWxxDGT repeat protein
VGGTVFFAGTASPQTELWKSDGTTDGTVLVKGGSVYWLTNVGGTLFFEGIDGLWKSDGTTDGTVLVKGLFAVELANLGGTLFFVSFDGRGGELWKSDGTTDGTVLVKDINPTGSSSPRLLTAVSGELFFAARDGVHGWELWKSNGTAQGTVLVKDINESGPSYPQVLTAVGDTLFFAARDGVHGFELWKSDGTRRGTRLVKDVHPGAGDSLRTSFHFHHPCRVRFPYFPYFKVGPSVCTELVGVGDRLYFGANDGRHGRELWRSDGTGAGTVMVKNISPHGNSTPRWLTRAGGRLFFSAYTPGHGRELWKSDGSSEGTTLVRDIWR